MVSPSFIRELAPAKLNLYLHVLGHDQRGYHLLDSLVTFADAADEVLLRPSDALSLEIVGPFSDGLESDERNLVWQAAVAFGEVTGKATDFAITLVKNLPVASGIGGGSADAAACLRALARYWDMAPTDPLIMQIAPRLGSDVPICVAGIACFMGGTGEILDPCPVLPEAAIVLVNPGFPLATSDVYAAREGDFSAPGRFIEPPATVVELVEMMVRLDNDLTYPAIALKPELRDVLRTIAREKRCLLARMLGSGATCFGMFATRGEADEAAESLTRQHPEWWVHSGRIVNNIALLQPPGQQALTG